VNVDLVRAVLLGRGLVWGWSGSMPYKSRLGFFAPSSHGQNQKARVHHFDLFLLDLGTEDKTNPTSTSTRIFFHSVESIKVTMKHPRFAFFPWFKVSTMVGYSYGSKVLFVSIYIYISKYK
jgi:hypothetical protein